MCWETIEKKHTQPKVARKTIKVFKLVAKNVYGYGYTPYFMDMSDVVYKRGCTYTHGKPLVLHDPGAFCGTSYYINEGFHSYNSSKVVLDQHWSYYDVVWSATRDGHKLCPYSIPPSWRPPLYKMQCIIPKGTTYYENQYGEIVSEAIVVKGFHIIKLNLQIMIFS